jgi:hypothetical protein
MVQALEKEINGWTYFIYQSSPGCHRDKKTAGRL